MCSTFSYFFHSFFSRYYRGSLYPFRPKMLPYEYRSACLGGSVASDDCRAFDRAVGCLCCSVIFFWCSIVRNYDRGLYQKTHLRNTIRPLQVYSRYILLYYPLTPAPAESRNKQVGKRTKNQTNTQKINKKQTN